MISHKHKCIFIHIPKTAGMSIYSFFYPKVKFHFNIPDYDRLFGWCPKRQLHMQHATAKQLLETGLISETQWKTYYKFTFVRNPWDRAYSDYKWIQEFSGIKGSFKDYIKMRNGFQETFTNISKSSYLGDHLLSQTDFFEFEGVYKPDFIGRFESFDKDIKLILAVLGVTKSFDIYTNKSKRKKDYSFFFTKTRKLLVDEKFKNDIKLLDYSFNDSKKGLQKLRNFL